MTCPRCAAEMRYLPPMKHTGFLAYVGSEVVFWIVAALIAGAISCGVDERYSLSLTFAGVASFVVFILLYRAGERSKRGPGINYCKACQYYRSPTSAKEGPGAI
jgi:hypothetical protein